MDLKKRNVLFLDLQTTGAKPGSAHILEIAWSTLHSEKIESHLIAQPEGSNIPRHIQSITGILDDDMDQAQSLGEVLKYFKTYLENETTLGQHPFAVIHFAQFEKPFLKDAYERIQNEMPFSILCTHEIAKRLLPNLPTRGIKGLAGYFGFPKQELKRAANHVQATQIIWQGLTSVLAEKSIHTLEDLHHWLQSTPKTNRVKYEYPLPKEKRLSLPNKPGVYRMISKWGEVLYVGKATSLHSRVNSYFRGQKNRDTRKLEMLTQVWDLHVTPVESPLEAALLETDEIKRLDPPYNVSLKAGQRTMAFFNWDFTSVNEGYDEEHTIGPFSNSLVLDSMLRLCNSVETGIFDENMFFEPLASALLKEAFELFCQRHSLNFKSFSSMRSILAVGLNWARNESDEDLKESEETVLPDSEQPSANEAEPTAEDIADKYERHFIRSAKAYLRAKKLTSLLNADIQFKAKTKAKAPTVLRTRHGQIVQAGSELSSLGTWKNLSIDTYDRMTVLLTELEKLRRQTVIKVEKLSV